MIRIVDIKGLKTDDDYALLSKFQQQYVAKLIRDFLKKEDIKAKVIVE